MFLINMVTMATVFLTHVLACSAKSAPKPQNTIFDLIKYCRGSLLILLAFIIAVVHIYLQKKFGCPRCLGTFFMDDFHFYPTLPYPRGTPPYDFLRCGL